MTKLKIGIIQGRLSRPLGGKIQSFPVRTWEQEFEKASILGLDAIEWIFEDPYQENPLWAEAGRVRIKDTIKRTGVAVDQICADYFMEHPFFRVPPEEAKRSAEILKMILPFSREIGASSVEIPLLDNSRIETEAENQKVIAIMREALPIAEENDLTLGFETSLHPEQFLKFMETLNHPNAKVVYDIGNSASLGYNPEVEIGLLKKYLCNVHLKDRLRGGTTVKLGTGNANFPATIQYLIDAGYQGPVTLQVSRGEPGQEVETTRSHIEFLKKLYEEK